MPNALIYLTTCYRGIKDQGTNLFSFIDVFDTIFIPKGSDFIWQTFYIGGRLRCDAPGHISIEVIFTYPDNVTQSPPSFINGQVQKGDVHFTANIPLTKFTQDGTYKLSVRLNGEEIENKNEFYFTVTKQL